MSKLTFENGKFTFDDHKVVQSFDDFLESLEPDSSDLILGPEKLELLMNFSSMLAAQHPQFLDAYAHAGGALLDTDEVGEAMVWYQRGLEIAYKVIPFNYEGKIDWSVHSNRPFLRIQHGLILCLIEKGELDKAIKEAEMHLSWNPSDNLGVRYLLGDLYLVANKANKGHKLMKRSPDMSLQPSFCYNEALLYFREGKFHEALTELRFGFISNPYIAEMLLGCDMPYEKPYWHSNSDESLDFAREYEQSIAFEAWLEEENAIAFLNWAYNCSISMQDRAGLMKLREELNDAEDKDRGTWVHAIFEFMNKINLKSSKTMNINIKGRSVETTQPWLNGAYK